MREFESEREHQYAGIAKWKGMRFPPSHAPVQSRLLAPYSLLTAIRSSIVVSGG
jgi:hypothetical protein